MRYGVRQDELDLWRAVAAGESMRDAARRIGMHERRAYYIANKWASRDWYSWGVVYDLGWVTGTGPETS